ncbi:MAG: aspartyl-tRNA(Asn)/glutamyl-tRNA(Gln) amidotransferase subunit B [Chitinophagales bacterium]|jgi:aspartyl-tRNA(Asn)/glutamyl-tRNA(Gln) amidotransferase subunit B
MEWETVIGLEIHAQLITNTKIFSGSSTQFGASANTQANEVDLALPGTLPVLNKEAVRKAILFGLAVNSEINPLSTFDRKNYFYPDLPKGYQTTQLAEPIVGEGKVKIMLANGESKIIRIHHAHLEEDAGKSLHEDYHGMTGIDLNRAGTPLLEIVTEPDMSNSFEAVAFARKLHSIITAIGVCDGKMSQGSMRFDVNVSVRPKGQQELGTRTETKNLNSFKFMEEAIHKEVQRQIEVIEDGGKIIQETRLYNGDTKVSRSMRSKEEANDYRYFPCPDLLPVAVDKETIEELRTLLPELPDTRESRLVNDYNLSEYDASIIAGNAAITQYFEAAAKGCGDNKLTANWVMGELSAKLNAEDISIADSPINAAQLGQLISRIVDDTISNKIAKQVFDALWNKEADSADSIIDVKGLKQVSDTGALEKIVDEVLASKPAEVQNYLDADESKRKKMLGAFMGPIMQATKGQANPSAVNKILADKLTKR